jgi:hypothetical protein
MKSLVEVLVMLEGRASPAGGRKLAPLKKESGERGNQEQSQEPAVLTRGKAQKFGKKRKRNPEKRKRKARKTRGPN